MLLMPFDDAMDGTAVPAFGSARAELVLVETASDFPGVEPAFPQGHGDAECLEFLGMASGMTALVLESVRRVPTDFTFRGDGRRFRGTLLDRLKNSRFFQVGADGLVRLAEGGSNLFEGVAGTV